MLVRALPCPARQFASSSRVTGRSAPTLLRLARELGVADRLLLLGWRTDTGALLAACDVLVCPSRVEPLGNIVLEAFAAARPVVATAVAGPLELIDPGRTGLLVPPNEPARLAAAIRSVIDDRDLASRLAAAGRAEWAAQHAEAPVVRRWREALELMAAG